MKCFAPSENVCRAFMNKCDVRQRVCAFDAANEGKKAYESQALCRIIQHKIPLCGMILCYMPLADEVDIRPLFDAIRLHGGTVVLPYCIDRETMLLKTWAKDAPLEADAMHVPAPKDGQIVAPQQIDAALIPAVALSKMGDRLGRGRGFYDRLLPHLRHDALKIGVCHSWRMQESLPTLGHDASVDLVAVSLLDGAHPC